MAEMLAGHAQSRPQSLWPQEPRGRWVFRGDSLSGPQPRASLQLPGPLSGWGRPLQGPVRFGGTRWRGKDGYLVDPGGRCPPCWAVAHEQATLEGPLPGCRLRRASLWL